MVNHKNVTLTPKGLLFGGILAASMGGQVHAQKPVTPASVEVNAHLTEVEVLTEVYKDAIPLNWAIEKNAVSGNKLEDYKNALASLLNEIRSSDVNRADQDAIVDRESKEFSSKTIAQKLESAQRAVEEYKGTQTYVLPEPPPEPEAPPKAKRPLKPDPTSSARKAEVVGTLLPTSGMIDFNKRKFRNENRFAVPNDAVITISNAVLDIQRVDYPVGTVEVVTMEGTGLGNFTSVAVDNNGVALATVKFNNSSFTLYREMAQGGRNQTFNGSQVGKTTGNEVIDVVTGKKTTAKAAENISRKIVDKGSDWIGNFFKNKNWQKQTNPATIHDLPGAFGKQGSPAPVKVTPYNDFLRRHPEGFGATDTEQQQHQGTPLVPVNQIQTASAGDNNNFLNEILNAGARPKIAAKTKQKQNWRQHVDTVTNTVDVTKGGRYT